MNLFPLKFGTDVSHFRWPFVKALAMVKPAAVAACAAAAAVLVLCAVGVARSGSMRAVLASPAKAAAQLPAVPGFERASAGTRAAESNKLFSYLSADAYTPLNEEHFLAKRLGVGAAAEHSPALAQRKRAKGKVPAVLEREGKFNVRYFSKFIDSGKPKHYTVGGMKASAYRLEQQRIKNGFADDDGVHYLGKTAAEQLYNELSSGEHSYLASENHGMLWQNPYVEHEIAADRNRKAVREHTVLGKAQDKALAQELEQGILWSALPDHGAAMHAQRRKDAMQKGGDKPVTVAAGKQLAAELVAGQEEALADSAAGAIKAEQAKAAATRRAHLVPARVVRSGQVVPGSLGKAEGERLAAQLAAGEREALLKPWGFGRGAEPAAPKMLGRAAGKKLAEELLAGERDALLAPYARGGKERAAVVSKTLGKAAGKQLAQELLAGEHEATLAPLRAQMHRTRTHHQQLFKEGRTLLAQKSAAKASTVPATAKARQGKLRRLWHVKPRAKFLTPAQDGNVAAYLKKARDSAIPRGIRHPAAPSAKVLSKSQERSVSAYLQKGIDTVFPAPKPEARRVLSKAAGSALVKAARQDQAAERRAAAAAHPAPRGVSAKAGMEMAGQMAQALRQEQAAGGRYEDKYLHRVTGAARSRASGKRYVRAAGRQRGRYSRAVISNQLAHHISIYLHMM